MINIQNLSKTYNNTTVLAIENIEIKRGESIGLVGNNGAGKTTLFSLLLDLIQVSTGEIHINGVNVHGSDRWKEFTGSFLDESFLIGYLTPEEYFYFIGDLQDVSKQDVDNFIAQYDDFFNGEILQKNKYIRDLSKGNQKKVGIIGALIGNPQLIVLDEPFANLDPSSQFRLKKLIRDLIQDREVTMLISSHDLSHTVEISDRIIALDKGRIIKDIQTSEETLEELNTLFAV
ncbi:ABC-2 type transport system ATP-binding protein [Sphingobacterium alimentarium]|jgi:ABC-2 type transport system ATP-binding protein|uniref:ABC-2 type transport system ATP-binding protein n=1 Tax=Sphingobacterium alimentarium TaxID=797292 RepID=A0A4R3VPX1_9SPHI|nr:ABC transporter ATP-binding protein [Sphingobacterium alimentarium]TCV06725.1 ABC-2 type transport system ATP-binding protein [Sphingobacterium alimentarium]